jgi:hypothetical protein
MFTKEQRKVYRQRFEVKISEAIYLQKWKIENEKVQFGPHWQPTWFVKYWEEKEQKKRESAARREAAEQKKPIEIRGVKYKDFTKEQKAIYQKWSHRSARSPERRATPEFKARHRESNKNNTLSAEYLERRRAKDRVRFRKLRTEDVEYQLLHSLRNRLRRIVGSARCERPTEGLTQAARDFVGCTLIELKTHLEAQFIGCMSWKNYGKAWHIDHRVPCAYFDLSTERGRRDCFHFTNLRPLWVKTNLRRPKKGESVQWELPFSQPAFGLKPLTPEVIPKCVTI